MSRLLKAPPTRVAGATPGTLTLEQALDTCARIAAALHTSGIALGHRRLLADELAELRLDVGAVQRVSPDLGAWLQARLEQLEAYAAGSRPLPLCFSHGDFTYTQLVFDGVTGGLVDFDTVCQAEPALDLGQFLAYLRLAVLTAQKTAAGSDGAPGEQLCARFVDTYVAAAGDHLGEAESLRARLSVYEIISLLRIALHSWQKLKGRRLEHALAVLEERIACLPRASD
jgi:aminoglycoside phosphotransferase (APT) family kinase protein